MPEGNRKSRILRTLKEYVNQKEDSMSTDNVNGEKNEEDIIETEKHFIPHTATHTVDIRMKIKNLINLYGEDKIYIGKTCNPFGRMTGNYRLSESVDESSENPEDYDTEPPHNVPHDQSGYGKMFIIYETENPHKINELEKQLIVEFNEKTRNRVGGGGGRPGHAPYYIYVVVQEDVL